jgi:hypothetical protein
MATEPVPTSADIAKIKAGKTLADKMEIAGGIQYRRYGHPNGSETGVGAYRRVLPKNIARINFNYDLAGIKFNLSWYGAVADALGVKMDYRASTGTLTFREDTDHPGDPLIEDAAIQLAEDNA